MWFLQAPLVQCGSLHDASHCAETHQCVIHDYTCNGIQHTFSRQRLKLSSKWAENSQSSCWWVWNFLGQGAYRSRSMATSYLGTWDLSVVAFLTIVAKVVSHSHGTWSVADISQADIKGSYWSRISRGSDWSRRLEGSQQRPMVRRINVWVTMIVRRRGGKPRWLSHWTSCTYSPWKVEYIQEESKEVKIKQFSNIWVVWII